MRITAVVLTMGNRPEDLRRALESILSQRDVDVAVTLVDNGSDRPVAPADGVHIVAAGQNLGVSGGRNLGVASSTGDLVFFLDDDAWLPDTTVLSRAVKRFHDDPRLGVLSLRVETPSGTVQRHHVPRLRVGDPRRSSPVTTFLGGACIVRRALLDEVGGFPDEFVYAHEETSLAWRALDAGWKLYYEGGFGVVHPEVLPTRHAQARRLAARNRVLLARRHLPAPLNVVYVATWFLLTMLRDIRGWRMHLHGTWDGLRSRGVPRCPIGWDTVRHMTRLGRPPIV